jgi:hypothetical protein
MKERIVVRTLATVVYVICMLCSLAGATCYFTGTTDTDWGTAGNWINGIPTDPNFAYLDHSHTSPNPAHAVISSGNYSTGNMTIGATSGPAFTLDIGSGSLTSVGGVQLGTDPCGVAGASGIMNINQSGSYTHNISADANYLYVGSGAGSYGEINVNTGGTLTANGYGTHIGSSGTGRLYINGGTVSADCNWLYVGSASGSDGEIDVNTGGTLTTTAKCSPRIGNSGTGRLNINGGKATINKLPYVSTLSGSSGSKIDVNSGTLILPAGVYVGYGDEGSMYVKGGDVNISGNQAAVLFGLKQSKGNLYMSDGNISCKGILANFYLGDGNFADSNYASGLSGYFKMDGGRFDFDGQYCYMGATAPALLEMNGGTINFKSATYVKFANNGADGRVKLNGGLIDASPLVNPLYVYSTVDVNGGTLVAGTLSPQTRATYVYPGGMTPSIIVNSGLVKAAMLNCYMEAGSTSPQPFVTLNGGTIDVNGYSQICRLDINGGLYQSKQINVGIYDLTPNGAVVNITGGTVKPGTHFSVGYYHPATLNMSGGQILEPNGGIYVGYQGAAGHMNMTDGYIEANVVSIGNANFGDFQFDRGRINTNAFSFSNSYDLTGYYGTMDITFGVIRVNGNIDGNEPNEPYEPNIAIWESMGWLTAFKNFGPKIGTASICTYHDAYANKTYIWADPEFVVIDDFEAYDGNISTVWSASGTATLSDVNSPIHGGLKAMKLNYSNGAGQSATASRNSPFQNWEAIDYNTLRLYFYGNAANSPVQLSVTISDGNNTATANYPGGTNAVQEQSWHQWDVSLSGLGVDMKHVASVAVTATGTGAGMVYFDDIRLDGRLGKRLVDVLAFDLNDDLRVDFKDFAIFAQGWQTTYDVNDLRHLSSQWLVDIGQP